VSLLQSIHYLCILNMNYPFSAPPGNVAVRWKVVNILKAQIGKNRSYILSIVIYILFTL